jgi:hypothetical protein
MQACLVDHAKKAGIRGFEAEVLPGNEGMISLARKCSGNFDTRRDEDGVHVIMMF